MIDNCLDDSICLAVLRTINVLDGVCGRVKIQKVLYFLDLDVKPSFSFFHYGPYSGDVEMALDRLELHGYITRERGDLACHHETVFTSTTWGRCFAVEMSQDISRVLQLLKGMSQRELEIISTIHFVWTVHACKGEDTCWEIVTELKPGARPREICKYLARLTNRGYL